jgi:hypothetical protein
LHNPDKPHLVRVIHQGVNYDRQVTGSHVISVDVADAADRLQGITGGIEIIRAGTQGNLLHVSDMIEIRNDSNPPMTQASERTFEVYLPANAKIDSVLAASPENIGAMISAAPVRNEPGHYTVSFPLRPGSTKFAFNYDLPYDGHATFRTKHMYPLQQVAVMIPPTMRFMSQSSVFQILPVGNDRYRVEAAEQVKAGVGPEFEISGIGALPSMQAEVHAPPKPQAGVLTALPPSTRNNSGPQGQNPVAPGVILVSKPAALLSPMQWVLSASAVLIFGTCGFLVWRRVHLSTYSRTAVGQITHQTGQTPASLVEALKDGLFQLEIDRLQGAISGKEYASAKQALERTIEWALARTGSRAANTRQEVSSGV